MGLDDGLLKVVLKI